MKGITLFRFEIIIRLSFGSRRIFLLGKFRLNKDKIIEQKLTIYQY